MSTLPESIEKYLSSTKLINTKDSKIQSIVNKLTINTNSNKEKAIQIHNYVRDSIKFGFSKNFYKESSVDVLKSGVGFCNTKSTLFITLLRAVNIPARQVFVNINAKILSGIISPGTKYVDHSYTEVYLNNRWIKTDSYVVDSKLFISSMKLLKTENNLIGYGVHSHGSYKWDGETDSFSQFINDGSYPKLTTKIFGAFEDTVSFYQFETKALNRQNIFENLIYRFFISGINRKIEDLRSRSFSKEKKKFIMF